MAMLNNQRVCALFLSFMTCASCMQKLQILLSTDDEMEVRGLILPNVGPSYSSLSFPQPSQWIGFHGKISTGNQSDFPSQYDKSVVFR